VVGAGAAAGRVRAGALDLGADRVAGEDGEGDADDHRARCREGVGEGAGKARQGCSKTIGSASVTARKAGALHLTLRLSSKARASFEEGRSPRGHDPGSFGRTTKTLHITLKRP